MKIVSLNLYETTFITSKTTIHLFHQYYFNIISIIITSIFILIHISYNKKINI